MSLDDGDEVGLMLLFSALGISIKNESEAEVMDLEKFYFTYCSDGGQHTAVDGPKFWPRTAVSHARRSA